MPPSAARALNRRAFATSARLFEARGPQSPSLGSTWATHPIPPESPAFVEIPTAKVPDPAPRPYTKGVLPRPKNLFPKRSAPYKGSPEFIAAATPEPSTPPPKPAHDPETRAFQQWQRRMAETRRSHLREGFSTLKSKQEESAVQLRERLARQQARRQERLNQAEAEDVRLTLPSVLSTLRLETGPLQDPDRAKRLQRMRMNWQVDQANKKNARKMAMLQLYNKAQDFIVTEQQLDQAIDHAFREDDVHAKMAGALKSMRGKSIAERLAERRKGSTGISKNATLLQVERALAGKKLAGAFSALAGDSDVSW